MHENLAAGDTIIKYTRQTTPMNELESFNIPQMHDLQRNSPYDIIEHTYSTAL